MSKNSMASVLGVENLSTAGPQWFALRVKSRCEKTVAAIAHNKGFEVFMPAYVSRRRWSDRVKSLELPLFPGYMFCRMEPQHRFPLLTLPGILQIVGIGKVPIPIEDHEIAAIQSIVQSGLVVEPWPFLEVGQWVRLDAGPLARFQGILIGTAKDQRVIASLTLLKRSIAVSVEHHWVTPLDGERRELLDLLEPDRRAGSQHIPTTTGENRIL